MNNKSKFEEWFNWGEGIYSQDPYVSDSKNVEENCAKYGWEACKNEMIKILDESEKYKVICAGKVEIDIDFNKLKEKIKEL